MKWKFLALGAGLSAILMAGSNYGGPNEIGVRATPTEDITVTGVQTIAERADCTFNEFYITGEAEGTDDDTGRGQDEVTFEVWDDGELKDSSTIKIPVGETTPFDVRLAFKGKYKTGVPGVGIYSKELGLAIDPFYPEDKNGTCPRLGIVQCWVKPHIIKAGKKVTFNAKIDGDVKNVILYNGNLPVKNGRRLVYLRDPDGDDIYSVTIKIPAESLSTGPWLFDYKIRARGEWKGDDWCPGIKVR